MDKKNVDKFKDSSALTQEDISLWQRFCHSLTQYTPLKEQSENTPSPKKPLIKPRSDTTLITRPSTSQPRLFPNEALDKNLTKRMRRGDVVIDDTIDLHGMTEHQAHIAFNRFITAARSQDKRNLLVITGKGKTYQSKGILRESMPKWIAMPDIMPYILAYCHAALKDGGSGAWYIMLRKNRK